MKRKFLNRNDWMQVVEGTITESITPVETVSVSLLSKIKDENELFFTLKQSTERVNFDGYQWTKTENGKRIQPAYRKININGISATAVQFSCANNPKFKKDILHLPNQSIVHYFMEEEGIFQIPDSTELKRRRFGGEISIDLKTNILPNSSLKAVFDISENRGYELTKRQIINLRRSVPETLIGKSGRRVVTSLEDAKKIAAEYPGQVRYYINNANELVFSFVTIFEDALNLFVAGCPLRTDYDKWTETVDSILLLSHTARKNAINDILKNHPTGLIYPSRLYIDSTYNLSDAYVTVILGESNNLITKDSKKPRCFPIGFMTHSHRDTVHHEHFSEYLKNAVTPMLTDKAAPSLLMDREAGLQVYATAFSTQII
ncbi:unnamed protein product [Caenorhabditis nigoni]